MEGDFLTYALNDSGKMVFVDDVPNGLACNCRCPQGHEPLVAKNGGEIREHHFAHASGSECEGAFETAFHLLAKEIISQEKSVMLPEYRHITREYMDEDECLDFEIIPSCICKLVLTHFSKVCIPFVHKQTKVIRRVSNDTVHATTWYLFHYLSAFSNN